MNRVSLNRRWFESILKHNWHKLVNLLSNLLVAPIETLLIPKRLSNNTNRLQMCLLHEFIFISIEESNIYAEFQERLVVILNGGLDYLDVKIDEFLGVALDCPEIHHLDLVCLRTVAEIGRVGISLDTVEFEYLS